MTRDKLKFPEGFCSVDNRGGFRDVIQVVENIPEDLMPPSFKKAEDFVRNVLNIQHGITSPQEARYGDFDKVCHYGQKAEDAVRDFDLHAARLAIEFGIDGGNWRLKQVKHLLDKDFADEWIEQKTQSPNVVGRVSLINKLNILASEVYNNKQEDFMDDKVRALFAESRAMGNKMDWETKTKEENRAIQKEASRIRNEGYTIINAKKQHIKNEIHKRAISNWYDKYAWDFDDEELKKLENPYK